MSDLDERMSEELMKSPTWLIEELKRAASNDKKPANIVRLPIILPGGQTFDIWMRRNSFTAFPNLKEHVFDLIKVSLDVFRSTGLRFRTQDQWTHWAERYATVAWRAKNKPERTEDEWMMDPQIKILLAFCNNPIFQRIIKDFNNQSDKKPDWIGDILNYWNSDEDYISRPQTNASLEKAVNEKEVSYRNVAVNYVIPSLIDLLVQNDLVQYVPEQKKELYAKHQLIEVMIQRYSELLAKRGKNPRTYSNRCYNCLGKKTTKRKHAEAKVVDAQLRRQFMERWQHYDQSKGTAKIGRVVTVENTMIIMRDFAVGQKGVGQKRSDTTYAGKLMHETLEEQEQLYRKIKKYTLEHYNVELEEGKKETVTDRREEEREQIKKSKEDAGKLKIAIQQIQVLENRSAELSSKIESLETALKETVNKTKKLVQDNDALIKAQSEVIADQSGKIDGLYEELNENAKAIESLEENHKKLKDEMEATDATIAELRYKQRIMRRNTFFGWVIVGTVLAILTALVIAG